MVGPCDRAIGVRIHHPTAWTSEKEDKRFLTPFLSSTTELHNKVNAIATLNLPLKVGKSFTLKFLLFDPDHASDSKIDESWQDINAAGVNGSPDTPWKSKDNLNTGTSSPFISSPGATLVTQGGSSATFSWSGHGNVPANASEVSALLTIQARQPGNNFIVAVNESSKFPDSWFEIDESSVNKGKKVINTEELDPDYVYVQTPILTVWRTLHVQKYHMQGPDWTITFDSQILAGTGTRVSDTEFTVTGGLDTADRGMNSFAGGTIQFLDSAGAPLGAPMMIVSSDATNLLYPFREPHLFARDSLSVFLGT